MTPEAWQRPKQVIKGLRIEPGSSGSRGASLLNHGRYKSYTEEICENTDEVKKYLLGIQEIKPDKRSKRIIKK